MDVEHQGQSGSSNKANKKRLSKQFLHVIQHHRDVGIRRAAELPFTLRVHRADLNPNIPDLGDAAGIILMGGPQAAYSDKDFPSRNAEIYLIQQALEANIPVLAICLGAQLLALAAGGNAYRRKEPENGWYPVELTTEGRQDPLFEGCPPTFIPRSHHADSFDMPPGAVRLASSKRCLEQAFRLGTHAWGTQFHFETVAGETVTGNAPESSIEQLAPIAHQIFLNFAHTVESHIVSQTAKARIAS